MSDRTSSPLSPDFMQMGLPSDTSMFNPERRDVYYSQLAGQSSPPAFGTATFIFAGWVNPAIKHRLATYAHAIPLVRRQFRRNVRTGIGLAPEYAAFPFPDITMPSELSSPGVRYLMQDRFDEFRGDAGNNKF